VLPSGRTEEGPLRLLSLHGIQEELRGGETRQEVIHQQLADGLRELVIPPIIANAQKIRQEQDVVRQRMQNRRDGFARAGKRCS
jgi:hypothetical protein